MIFLAVLVVIRYRFGHFGLKLSLVLYFSLELGASLKACLLFLERCRLIVILGSCVAWKDYTPLKYRLPEPSQK